MLTEQGFIGVGQHIKGDIIYFIDMATQDTLQAAKRTFLTSTETKSPLKRPLTPEPDLEEEVSMPKYFVLFY